jgi:hypothetical protein
MHYEDDRINMRMMMMAMMIIHDDDDDDDNDDVHLSCLVSLYVDYIDSSSSMR